jgi:uncharacterized protein YggE
MRPVRIAAVALLVLAAAALAGVGRPDFVFSQSESEPDGSDPTRSITASGTATVVTVPDEATFTFGVDARGDTASAALSAASAATKRITDAIKDAGVDAKDIQTENISLSTVTSSDGRHIDGFAASASITVHAKDLDSAGQLVDAAVAAGANNVYGPSLSRSDADELAEKALADAVADARRKAEALAEAAGGSLGKVIAVTESGSTVPPMPYAAREAALATDVAIEPGTQEIQSSVTVVFELR